MYVRIGDPELAVNVDYELIDVSSGGRPRESLSHHYNGEVAAGDSSGDSEKRILARLTDKCLQQLVRPQIRTQVRSPGVELASGSLGIAWGIWSGNAAAAKVAREAAPTAEWQTVIGANPDSHAAHALQPGRGDGNQWRPHHRRSCLPGSRSPCTTGTCTAMRSGTCSAVAYGPTTGRDSALPARRRVPLRDHRCPTHIFAARHLALTCPKPDAAGRPAAGDVQPRPQTLVVRPCRFHLIPWGRSVRGGSASHWASNQQQRRRVVDLGGFLGEPRTSTSPADPRPANRAFPPVGQIPTLVA